MSCVAQDWKVVKFDHVKLCLSTAYPWKESRIGGVLGSYLEYVYVDYPYKLSNGENRILSVLVRPNTKNKIRQKKFNKKNNKMLFDKSVGLYIKKLPNGSEMAVAPAGEKIVKSAVPGTFESSCLDALPKYCVRSFQDKFFEGSYSFARDKLKEWKEWEFGLDRFLKEKVVRDCDELKEKATRG